MVSHLEQGSLVTEFFSNLNPMVGVSHWSYWTCLSQPLSGHLLSMSELAHMFTWNLMERNKGLCFKPLQYILAMGRKRNLSWNKYVSIVTMTPYSSIRTWFFCEARDRIMLKSRKTPNFGYYEKETLKISEFLVKSKLRKTSSDYPQKYTPLTQNPSYRPPYRGGARS